jgi:hypothetical protein
MDRAAPAILRALKISSRDWTRSSESFICVLHTSGSPQVPEKPSRVRRRGGFFAVLAIQAAIDQYIVAVFLLRDPLQMLDLQDTS